MPPSPLIFQDKESYVPPKDNLDVPTVGIQEGFFGSDQDYDDDDDSSSEGEDDPRDLIVGNMIKVFNGHLKTREGLIKHHQVVWNGIKNSYEIFFTK